MSTKIAMNAVRAESFLIMPSIRVDAISCTVAETEVGLMLTQVPD